jgi:hypothetical protein
MYQELLEIYSKESPSQIINFIDVDQVVLATCMDTETLGGPVPRITIIFKNNPDPVTIYLENIEMALQYMTQLNQSKKFIQKINR